MAKKSKAGKNLIKIVIAEGFAKFYRCDDVTCVTSSLAKTNQSASTDIRVTFGNLSLDRCKTVAPDEEISISP